MNLQNVEEVIFMDKRVWPVLPEFRHLFDSWNLGTRVTALRNLARRSVMDFLNGLQDEHIVKLSEYFDEPVTVDKLDYHVVRNLDVPLENAVGDLEKCDGFLDLAICRKGSRLYISLWK